MTDGHSKVDLNLLRRLKSVRWFQECGSILDVPLTFPYEQVLTWAEAERVFFDTNWSSVILDASNELTRYLHEKYLSKYQYWNEVVRAVKAYLQSEILPSLELGASEASLTGEFVDSAKWDVVGAFMESAYADCRPPVFFLRLLPVYEAGHMPCGWKGKRPKGKLVVY